MARLGQGSALFVLHLMEQPIDGFWSAGATPVVAIARMASTSSRGPPVRPGCAAFLERAAILELAVGIVTEEVRRTAPYLDRLSGSRRGDMETGNHELSRNASCSQMSLRDSSPRRSSNRCKAYALRHQDAGVRNHAVDHRFDIGTIVRLASRLWKQVPGRPPSAYIWAQAGAIWRQQLPKSFLILDDVAGALRQPFPV